MDHPQEAFAAAPVASSGAPCGNYQTITGTARRIDTVNGMILLTGQRVIPIPDIFDVAIQEDALP